MLDPYHPAAASGEGVLRIIGTGRVVDADALRADLEARIVTDDPEAICRVLGIPFPDPQVIEEK